MSGRPSASAGFTLIELIIVIVLMSIVSLAGIEIINSTSESYDKMLGRHKMGNAARLAVDRISRELRHALPETARVADTCIEFIPINAAGNYIDLPVESSALSFQAVSVDTWEDSVLVRVAVYPVVNNVYELSSTGVLSGIASLGPVDVNNEMEVTLASLHQFPFHSPSRRFFLVAAPVSYCIDGDHLFRYTNYAITVSQPGIPSLPSSLPDRALLVDQVGTSINPFTVTDSSLERNAVVRVDLAFSEDGESMQIVHEVQLRNVP